VIKSPIDCLFKIKVMKGKTFGVTKSSKNKNTLWVGPKETQFGYFANSGVRDSLFAGGSIILS
jgi:hypothetical protein